jgi:glycosyltransferase involved in cell wall biosynthesis
LPQPEQRSSPRLIIDFCDVDSDKWLQYSKSSPFPSNRFYHFEHRWLLEYEKQINRRFDHSIFVSQHEAGLFQGLYPGAQNLHVIPNGVDYDYFSPENFGLAPQASSEALFMSNGSRDAPQAKRSFPLPPPTLVFTGAMDYHPNVDGVRWFHDEVLPAIKRRAPKIRFLIVGSNPHSKIRALGQRDNVTVTGFVEDIRPYYQSADICVVPLRLARGVQNKVLEAMAMAKPVVATTKAIEGIQALNREHVLVEDTVEGFVNAVSWLLENPQEGMDLGQRARRFVMERYDWSKHMKKLELLLRQD